MKKLLLAVVCSTLIFSSCKKGGDSDKEPETKAETITISGTAYPVVKIGNKTWTSVNYNGPGGKNYNEGTNDPVYGKLYTAVEAKAITLPAGWRLPIKADLNSIASSVEHTVDSDGDYSITSDGSKALKSTTTWTNTAGSNSTGFNATAAGIGVAVNVGSLGPYHSRGTSAAFMGIEAQAVVNNKTVYDVYMLELISETYKAGNQTLIDNSGFVIQMSEDFRFSLRFVKDN